MPAAVLLPLFPRMRLFAALSVGAVACFSALVASGQTTVPAAEPPAKDAEAASKFKGEDGWVDVSGFLDETYGFLPIAMPITEPAVGYGLGGGLLFLDQALGNSEYKRPNITGVFGFGTENGTWGAGAADIRMWMNDKLQTTAALFKASVNLDFYGIGEDPILAENPRRYNLDMTGGVLMGKYQLGKSRWMLGMGYLYFATKVSFDSPDSVPGLPDYSSKTNVGGIVPSITYDTRDNIFTPTKGLYMEATMAVFGPTLGADGDYQRGNLVGMYFHPLSSKLFFGIKGQVTATFGDPPFFVDPYIQLRGAPAMQFQGQEVAQAEAELRWQFWRRFSVVGFAGTGKAWSDLHDIERDRSIVTGGGGFRYEIARKYGIHAGFDVAWGPDTTALYIQVGSAWARP
jgi:Omp85 superfamily domain